MTNIKVTLIPDPITMKSIKYDWLGRIKEVEFRSLEEIKQVFPDYTESVQSAKYIVTAVKP